MAKLKYEIYNKGIEMEKQLYNQLEKYDTSILGVVDEKLEALKKELEEIEINSNIITIDTDMNEYLNKQQRLKELPIIIADVEKEKQKLITNKEDFKNKLCKGIAAEIGTDYAAEFEDNMGILINEYDKHLTKMIELHEQMEELERDYQGALFETIHTKGVYMTFDKAAFVNGVHGEHNIRLNLANAK